MSKIDLQPPKRDKVVLTGGRATIGRQPAGAPHDQGRGGRPTGTQLGRAAAEIEICAALAVNASPALLREVAQRDRIILGHSSIDLAATIFNVGRIELLGPRRTRKVLRPRFAAGAVMVELCGLTYSDIGQLLNRDHTTIISAMKQHDALLQIDADYADRYSSLRAAVAGVRMRQTGEPSAFVEIERNRLIGNLQGAIAALSIIEPILAQRLTEVMTQDRAMASANAGHGPSTRQSH